VIVVVGRPGLNADGEVDGACGQIAVAAARAGGRVELVGTVGDDADGDAVITELGRNGIGHAAVLRDPAGATPRIQSEPEKDVETNADTDAGAATSRTAGRMPRLDAADIDLGLRYLAECQVLVVAEPLPDDALAVAGAAAAYHGAQLLVMAEAGAVPPADLPEKSTLLERPAEDGGAFVQLVGRYAALLDSGRSPLDAWRDAIETGGWEPASE
jgi:sugar/nucleoside kinase (ribokinase family)